MYGTIRFRLCDDVDQFIRDIHRVEVHEPNPVEAVDFFKLVEKRREPRFAVAVEAVVGRVLGDDD